MEDQNEWVSSRSEVSEGSQDRSNGVRGCARCKIVTKDEHNRRHVKTDRGREREEGREVLDHDVS